ncbi:MAG: hypothetical protein RMM51_04490 [Verrucomicrobiae bacterium]|nr:hypothetical protein [Verrucomicrobiae bacterium]
MTELETTFTNLRQLKSERCFLGCATYRLFNPGVPAWRFEYGMEARLNLPFDDNHNDPFSCNWPNGQWFKLDSLTYPSTRILVADSRDWVRNDPLTALDDIRQVIRGMRHRGEANYLFVDGRVQSLPAFKGKALKDDPRANIP